MLSKFLAPLWFILLSLIALSSPFTEAAFPPKYRIVDVSPLQAAFDLKLTGLNESGSIVGSAFYFPEVQRRSFVYAEGQHTLIGNPGDIAVAINHSGQIAGYSEVNGHEGFLIAAGERIQIGTPGGHFSIVRGINDAGVVVGADIFSAASNPTVHAFSYSADQLTDIGTLPTGDGGTATGINDAGVIVGLADTDHGIRGFIYANAHMQELTPFLKAVSFPNDYSDARAINDAGQIVGSSINADGNLRAYLFNDGEMKDLGTLPGISKSFALSLNEDGDVVGNANELGNASNNPNFQNDSRGFLYTDGQMFDLNDLVPAHDALGVLAMDDSLVANGRLINRRGQILAVAVTAPYRRRSFLLEPVPPVPGAYTVLINPPADSAVSQACGWARATLRKNGKVFLDGRLGNNTPLHAEGKLLPDRTFQISQPAKASGRDAFSVPIRFKSKSASDFSGLASWAHPAGNHDPESSVGYNTTVSVQGMQLQTPAFADGRYRLSFAGEGFLSPRLVTFRYHRRSGVSELSNRSAKIQFNAHTGVFRGAVIFPDSANRFSFSGVIDQTAQLGKGLYENGSDHGAIELQKLR